MSQNCIPLNRQFLTPFNDWSFSPHQGIGCWVASFLNVVWFALLKGGCQTTFLWMPNFFPTFFEITEQIMNFSG